ncbi:membrane protein [Candidatus Magnetobacterium bavaricum]|uniref:Membrane protein n=1 Tax=Candidatus Magnetobacterium bavaricum TaxID=29290 RepID=A0A0F3GPJ9_9BACT|nr:membrane protein [Candidatus Magnetobacterium bavaricum]
MGLGRHLDLDLSGLYGLSLGQQYPQNTILNGGLYAVSVNLIRKGKAALIVSYAVFSISRPVLIFYLQIDVSGYRQHVLFKRDIHRLLIHSRDVGYHQDVVVALNDVHQGVVDLSGPCTLNSLGRLCLFLLVFLYVLCHLSILLL